MKHEPFRLQKICFVLFQNSDRNELIYSLPQSRQIRFWPHLLPRNVKPSVARISSLGLAIYKKYPCLAKISVLM